jgi:uncharacterized DUF497 family protein
MGFEWDKSNEEHCQKHGVTQAEIEWVIMNGAVFPDNRHSQVETRFLAIGFTPYQRWVFAAFTYRDDLIRPVMARFLHRKEIQKWLGN